MENKNTGVHEWLVGVHKINTTTSPKIIDKDIGCMSIWEVYEVNEVCVLKDEGATSKI